VKFRVDYLRDVVCYVAGVEASSAKTEMLECKRKFDVNKSFEIKK